MTDTEANRIRKKVCMLGAFAVGKTSLVIRFVESMFSERYETTVGVKIHKKEVSLPEKEVTFLIWDLYGEDQFQRMRTSYLRGAAGYLLVVDGTRAGTLEVAMDLHERVRAELGEVPFLLLVNKSDLQAELEVDAAAIERLRDQGIDARVTSAKTGEGVEAAFLDLAKGVCG